MATELRYNIVIRLEKVLSEAEKDELALVFGKALEAILGSKVVITNLEQEEGIEAHRRDVQRATDETLMLAQMQRKTHSTKGE